MLQTNALRRPAAQLKVYKMRSRLRRAELRVGRFRRELLDAQVDLNNIEFEMMGNEVQRASRRVAKGRKVAEDAYAVAHEQFGSDVPTLPDCLADDVSSDLEVDEESEDGEEEEEDDDEDDDVTILSSHDAPTDSEFDDRMDLDGVVPPIHVDD
ncbi:hypothetical protein SCHPADRAFT_948380 [Schizopora paradoxa]|uniref:Uncharacterized protein n=1 Tax=Schizopora paradoxa TaxID=27342 RepID=A0A0H2RFQ3_9AGAM|nr:hypothetical protein SCHPADRAFT_948380 [Schizopora paradoxa]